MPRPTARPSIPRPTPRAVPRAADPISDTVTDATAVMSPERIMEYLTSLPESERATILATLTKPSVPAPPVSEPQRPFRAALKTEDLEFDETETELPAAPPPVVAPAPPILRVVAAANPPADPVPWVAPSPPPASRLSSADIIDLLFDAMHNLHFFETAVEGASYCLSVVLGAIPSRGGIVSLYDVDSREFVVAYAQGRHTERLLLTRAPESDPLIAEATGRQRPCVHSYAEDSATAPDRFAFFGEMRSVIVAPVMDGGRFLAVIELVDPTDGSSFSEREVNALTYVTDHLTEYLASRGSAVGKIVAPPSGTVEHIG